MIKIVTLNRTKILWGNLKMKTQMNPITSDPLVFSVLRGTSGALKLTTRKSCYSRGMHIDETINKHSTGGSHKGIDKDA